MTDNTLHPIDTPRRNDLIADRLREHIVQSQYEPGDRLPTEEVLAHRLGVSRSAVREALRGLEAVGLVEARQGFGWVVCEFSFKPILKNLSYGLHFRSHDILHLIEIRKAIDTHFLDATIRNLTRDDLVALSDLTARMREKNAARLPISDEDYQFHRLLHQRSANPLALELFEIYWAVLYAAVDSDRVYTERPPGTARAHTEILEAIKLHDVVRARTLMLDHYRNIEERFRVDLVDDSLV
jgi:DNA-binding FadR family transcriptional regulator